MYVRLSYFCSICFHRLHGPVLDTMYTGVHPFLNDVRITNFCFNRPFASLETRPHLSLSGHKSLLARSMSPDVLASKLGGSGDMPPRARSIWLN